MVEYDKEGRRRLLVGYSDERARKDACNREKGIRRLEKAYRRKDKINKRGYNKFLKMEGGVRVSIDYDKLETDARWDGLKGYLTNTNIQADEAYAAYYNLWHVERAFHISKSKIEIRPMFHFTRRRIEAHVCLFCGVESLQGTEETCETIKYKHECGQGSGTCPDYCDNTDDAASE